MHMCIQLTHACTGGFAFQPPHMQQPQQGGGGYSPSQEDGDASRFDDAAR